jgi:toxin CptA
MRSVPAIVFDYRPSRRLATGLAVGGIMAVVSLLLCGLPWLLKVTLAMIALVYSAWSLRRFLRPPFIRIAWHPEGHWRVHAADDSAIEATLASASLLAQLLVLRLALDSGGTFTIVLLPDNTDSDLRRRLRLRLARADALADRLQSPPR